MTKNATQGSINQQIFPLIEDRFLSELPEPPLFEYIAPELADPNWITNANLTFSPQSDRWSVSAYVRNLSDKWVATSATAFANFVTVRPDAPRTYGARIVVKF